MAVPQMPVKWTDRIAENIVGMISSAPLPGQETTLLSARGLLLSSILHPLSSKPSSIIHHHSILLPQRSPDIVIPIPVRVRRQRPRPRYIAMARRIQCIRPFAERPLVPVMQFAQREVIRRNVLLAFRKPLLR